MPLGTREQYVGTFPLRPGLELVIKVQGDQLLLEPSGQPSDVLYAQSEAKFFSKRIDATIEFLRDAQAGSPRSSWCREHSKVARRGISRTL